MRSGLAQVPCEAGVGAETNPVRPDRLTVEPPVAAAADEVAVVLGGAAIHAHEVEAPAPVEWLRGRLRRLIPVLFTGRRRTVARRGHPQRAERPLAAAERRR